MSFELWIIQEDDKSRIIQTFRFPKKKKTLTAKILRFHSEYSDEIFGKRCQHASSNKNVLERYQH